MSPARSVSSTDPRGQAACDFVHARERRVPRGGQRRLRVTFLQELLAHQLGLELGSYTHMAGSYHLYETDQAMADRVLADRTRVSDHPFPAMPSEQLASGLRGPRDRGRASLGSTRPRPARDRGDGLPPYWEQVVTLLALHARRRFEAVTDQTSSSSLCALCRAGDELLARAAPHRTRPARGALRTDHGDPGEGVAIRRERDARDA